MIYRITGGDAKPVHPSVAAVSPSHDSEREVLWLSDRPFRMLAKTRTEMHDGILYEIELVAL